MHLCYVALAQLTPSKSSTQLNFTPAKRRCWKAERTFQNDFRSSFQGCEYRCASKSILKGSFGLPTSSFGRGKVGSPKRRVRKDDQTVRVRMFLVALEGSTQGWHTQRFCFRTASLLLIARPMLVRGKNHCDAAAGDTFLQ